MANDTFATFKELSSLGSADYLVGYRNLDETKINYNNLLLSFNSTLTSFGTYSVVNPNSASWNSVYSNVNSSSAKWNSSYTNLNTNSAFYGFISAVLFS